MRTQAANGGAKKHLIRVSQAGFLEMMQPKAAGTPGGDRQTTGGWEETKIDRVTYLDRKTFDNSR